MSTTIVTICCTTYETAVYELDGELDETEAEMEVASGMYDPVRSKVMSDDFEVIDLEVRT